MLVFALLHWAGSGQAACNGICQLTERCLGAQRFPIVVSEFGSALNERSELDCFTSITDYFTSSGLANDGRHAPIQSWFYWCALQCLLTASKACCTKVMMPARHCSTAQRTISDFVACQQCKGQSLLAKWVHKVTSLVSWDAGKAA